jgi:ATP-binding cassette subfamily C (CFTR/MRP) protein 1
MTRGALVSAIYRKTFVIGINSLDNSAAVSLMSTDTERIMVGLIFLHEVWANLVQVGLATWLLSIEVGVFV